MLYCPNFFWNVLQVWMTGKDVYLQMTWSWPDKTWNILCSYCLQWNTSQSKFRNHYFLFLFAFSILSQLFLIWDCKCFIFLGHWWRTGGDWDECWSKRRMTFPSNWCNSGFKGGCCPGCCKRCESDVTYGQEWWPILGICALHLSHPKCTHTHTHTHTHTPWTHTRSSQLCCGARGAVGGSVPCSRAPQSWYWGWRECCTFTPPTYNSCRQPLGYESDSLTIRPRLPPSHAVLMGLLHDYINYAKEIMKIDSDTWSVFMDYETNCKCIICKNQMLNACCVV